MLLDASLSVALLCAGGWLASHATGAAQAQPQTDASMAVSTAQSASSQDAQTPAAPASSDHLKVSIAPVQSDAGQIIALVFDNASAYAAYDPYQAVALQQVPAQTGAVELDFPALTDGPYAVFVFHDADADMDFDMQGDIPQEGYGGTGMINWYDTPDFNAAAVSAAPVTIPLFYP